MTGSDQINFASGGHYELDLSSPYDRSLLRMLYKKCDAIGLLDGWLVVLMVFHAFPGKTPTYKKRRGVAK